MMMMMCYSLLNNITFLSIRQIM